MAERLSKYQMCVEKPGSFCPDVNALCRVVRLNGDLLQHLVSLCTLIGWQSVFLLIGQFLSEADQTGNELKLLMSETKLPERLSRMIDQLID